MAAVVQMRAVGASSGTSAEARFGYTFEVEEGLVTRVVFYPDPAEMPGPPANDAS